MVLTSLPVRRAHDYRLERVRAEAGRGMREKTEGRDRSVEWRVSPGLQSPAVFSADFRASARDTLRRCFAGKLVEARRPRSTRMSPKRHPAPQGRFILGLRPEMGGRGSVRASSFDPAYRGLGRSLALPGRMKRPWPPIEPRPRTAGRIQSLRFREPMRWSPVSRSRNR